MNVGLDALVLQRRPAGSALYLTEGPVQAQRPACRNPRIQLFALMSISQSGKGVQRKRIHQTATMCERYV